MIRKHTRRAAKAAFAISFGVAIVLGVFAGTARPATHAAPTIVIGTKNFPEEYILGELYRQALEAKGFTVDNKENIGSTEIIQTALTSGKINFYPEYTGVIVQDVFHHTTSPKTAAATYALAKQLEAAKGYTCSNPTPFSDTDVLAVTNATAKKYGLKTISDLKKVGAVQARRVPGVPDPQHLLPRLHEAVRAHEGDLQVRRQRLALRRARLGDGARGRRLLDRPAARGALEVHGAHGPEAHHGLPERRRPS